MLTPSNSLAAAYLAIYIILLLPTFYILFRHGRHGILGWAYLLAFCLLRITGSGLQLSSSSSSSTLKTAETINGVGLSPLFLAVVGVLHEACHYIKTLAASSHNNTGATKKKPFLLGTVAYIAIHLIVGLGLAMVVVGATATPNPELVKEKVGYFVFLVVFIVLSGFVFLAWRATDSGSYARDVKVLLYAPTIALPFLLIRIIYTLAASFDSHINAQTGPIAYRVVLQALMEFIITIELVVFGIVSRNICRNVRAALDATLAGGVPLQQRVGPHPGAVAGPV